MIGNSIPTFSLAICLLFVAAVSGCADAETGLLYAELPAPSQPLASTTDEWSADADTVATDPQTQAVSGAAHSTGEEPADDSSGPTGDSAQQSDVAGGQPPPQNSASDPAEADASAAEAQPKPTPDASQPATDRPQEGSSADDTPSDATEGTSVPMERPDPSAPAADSNPLATSTDAPAKADGPREIKLLVPEKRFKKEGTSGSLRISYDDIDLLKVLNMEPVPANAVEYFPDWLKQLDGQRIRLRGFMFPTFLAEGITSFGLARDNGICCFVKEPKIYDMIQVSLADGVTTDYIDNRPFDVEGVFRIDPDADDDELFQLYRIEDAVVLQ